MFNFFKKREEPQVEIKETPKVDYENCSEISQYFEHETGITFDAQSSILKNKLILVCKKRDIYSFKELLYDVKQNHNLKQELINTLTTNETYFYREFKQVSTLVSLVQKNPKKSIKILCAPSATGEEPYSIVIALLEAGVRKDIEIVGIDINSSALAHAKEAIYTQRHIEHLPEMLLHKYFERKENHFHLKSSVTSKVTFEQKNIFNDDFKNLGTFDYIFSRNMLIYFPQERRLQAKKILENMRNNETEIFFGHADLI
jgi:chemotaxis protein methyltransferase CheR